MRKPLIVVCTACHDAFYFEGRWHRWDEETAMRISREAYEPMEMGERCEKCQKK